MPLSIVLLCRKGSHATKRHPVPARIGPGLAVCRRQIVIREPWTGLRLDGVPKQPDTSVHMRGGRETRVGVPRSPTASEGRRPPPALRLLSV